MSTSQIVSLQTGVPDFCYSQEQITEFYVNRLALSGNRRHRSIRTVMGYSGVDHRHSVVDADFFTEERTTQERNDRYMEEAVPLGERVIRKGLAKSGVSATDIDHFIVVSCTGFNVPGLDLLLAHRLGMSPHLNRTQIFGMGCYAAFPGIRRAIDSINNKPNQLALVLCLELCTLHLPFDDAVESVVSTSLFADGVAMTLIGNQDQTAGPQLIDSDTYCDYQTLDHMTFMVTDHGFRMYLSTYVSDVLAAQVRNFIAPLLKRNQLNVSDVKFWAIHPGSKRIVEYLQEQLQLSDEQVRPSLDVLRDYGNMSSATVMFVLDHINQFGEPRSGDYGVMMAFGPGLTMESMLVRW